MAENPKKQTILIVDDEPENIRLIGEILAEQYSIFKAQNGRDALKYANRNIPDLILLDLMMPEMDGYEVLKRLKAERKTQDIPVIIVTAMGRGENEALGIKLGAVDFIPKPISPTALRARIRLHLELTQYRNHLEQLVFKRTEELAVSNKKYRNEINDRKQIEEKLRLQSEALKKAAITLKKHRNQLETLVQERTAELQKTNQRLTHEINERKLSEKEMILAKKSAEDANKTKSDFLARMSHEIRTPMNAVIGFTDMLLDTSLDETQLDFVNTIKVSGEALLTLINDILDFSKIEAGELIFEKRDFCPEDIAFDVCEIIKHQVSSKPVEILCRISADLPSLINGDPSRFRQVLINLMGNASKFTEEGEIELSIRVEEETDDAIKLCSSIRDTGIGIPQDQIESIFLPFRQVKDKLSSKAAGTGLGLSICKQLSGLMQGDLWVESPCQKTPAKNRSRKKEKTDGSKSVGSCFYFTAWLKKSEKKSVVSVMPEWIKNITILMADDNETHLDILSEMFGKNNDRIYAVKSGKAVVRAVEDAIQKKRPFDFCIIDTELIGADVYQIAKQITSMDGYNHPPCVFGMSDNIEVKSKPPDKKGFTAFISKPVKRNLLLNLIEKHVSPVPATVKNSEEPNRILLVEDSLANQKLAQAMFTKAGYKVTIAQHGIDALEKLEASPDGFDLIVMDVQMPEMDGIQATKEIRKRGYHQIPIIAMTAHAMKGDREKCLDAGMNEYITKPIAKDHALSVIEEWIKKGT